ncbi:GDP-mannose 4,6-dehydratase [archaeon]|jgi:GDPmannose 4,6-dehydratase|nr:GDP-mannose 4,6-dehydratase [archaeon]
MKKAFITGITGQDGSYLAELLLKKGYSVYGLIRMSSTSNTSRIDHIKEKINLVYGDLTDSGKTKEIIREIMPDEVYNLAAQSHVGVSFKIPEYTAEVTGIGTLNLLEAIRQANLTRKTKFYQASTSELFGKVKETPQTETTPFHPRSPYGCAKLFSLWISRNYLESYGLFSCNGILFNHESPRRGKEFVTRKITLAVAKIKKGLQKEIELGNLNSKRDWGHAKDYVEGMWMMLQKETPRDYVLSTGETHSVREFLEEAFLAAGIEIESNGKAGISEEYFRKDNGKRVVKINPDFYRPAEVDLLLGDSSKAKNELGWKPKIAFKKLVEEMVKEDLKKDTYL